MPSLLLVEDHALVRSGIRALLERSPDLRVVGEASDGRQAVEMARNLMPDLAVVDVGMPNLNGIETTRILSTDSPQTRVVILSMHADPEYVEKAMDAGARAYVLKDSAYTELLTAIQQVMQGQRFLSPQASNRLHEADVSAGARGGSRLEKLSVRERQVLQLIGEGQSSPEIAKMLDLSVRTVETYRQNLMNKLAIHSIAGLTKFAIRHGICSGDPYQPL